jgi:hypothetical protein
MDAALLRYRRMLEDAVAGEATGETAIGGKY